MPADTQRFMSAFYEVAGDPDPVATMQSFVVRQSLLRAWGEFQEQHPLIVAPIFTDLPFEVGTDLADGRVAQTIRGMRMALAVNALGLPAVALPVGIGDGLPQVSPGDRPSLPRGPMPGCRGGAGGQARHHHANRSQVAAPKVAGGFRKAGPVLPMYMMNSTLSWTSRPCPYSNPAGVKVPNGMPAGRQPPAPVIQPDGPGSRARAEHEGCAVTDLRRTDTSMLDRAGSSVLSAGHLCLWTLL